MRKLRNGTTLAVGPTMRFSLDKVVPWGRSYEEYIAMFSLTETELELPIVGCGDGPASFNSKLTKRGGNIVSVDPIYAFDAGQIRTRISETYETVIRQMHENQHDYVCSTISSVEELGRVRMDAMDAFLSDYDSGKSERRYIAGELPSLPLESRKFDLGLCSHFLFLYSTHLSAEFHLQAMREMLRVAGEVRVFPLLNLDGVRSPHLDFVTEELTNSGLVVEIERVQYAFQQGGNDMLRVRKPNQRFQP
jgi:hypothetical protein